MTRRQLAVLFQNLQCKRRRRQRQRRARKQRRLPMKAERDTNRAKRAGRQDHLRRTEPKNRLPHREQALWP